MKPNEFIAEAKVKPYKTKTLDLKKVYNNLRAYCSESLVLESSPIWRGFSNIPYGVEALKIDPRTGKRESQNTSNHYTELIDHSPYFKGWPKRSKSLVCTNSLSYAQQFGDLYAIFPFNGVKIAVCPYDDIWGTKVRIPEVGLFFSTLDGFNRYLDDMLELPESYLGMTQMVKTPEFANRLRELIQKGDIGEIAPNKIIPLFQLAMSPEKAGFKLASAANFSDLIRSSVRKEREVWIGGQVIAISYSVFDKLFNEQYQTESFNSRSLQEGGWASALTQNTHITPQLVKSVIPVLQEFVNELNIFLDSKKVPPVEMGPPAGSVTYFERDLQSRPDAEYGDIDINLFVPRLDKMTANANLQFYRKEVQEFCKGHQEFQTTNGANIIFNLGKDYIQVDLIMSLNENKEWSKVLAPEWQVKGILTASLYSSLGAALNLSVGGQQGVQAKFRGTTMVPFNQMKDTVTVIVTNNPKTWALDIAKFLKCKRISTRLKDYPGMISEPRAADIVNSIRGIAESLEMNGKGNANDILTRISVIFLNKIKQAINSSKFEKAETPIAIQKAKDTKEMLTKKSREISKWFGV